MRPEYVNPVTVFEVTRVFLETTKKDAFSVPMLFSDLSDAVRCFNSYSTKQVTVEGFEAIEIGRPKHDEFEVGRMPNHIVIETRLVHQHQNR